MRISEQILGAPSSMLQSARSPVGESFGDVLQRSLQQVNQLQIDADDQAAQLATGRAVELHQVMIAGEKAQLALQLTIAVRNKVVEAYQELSRMQI